MIAGWVYFLCRLCGHEAELDSTDAWCPICPGRPKMSPVGIRGVVA